MADANEVAGGIIEVVYALPEKQCLVSVEYEPGMTAADAVTRSRLPEQFPEITAAPLVLGLYGRRIDSQYSVRPGDRVEICRPLQRDPRELRRFMTSQGRVIGQREADNDEGEDSGD